MFDKSILSARIISDFNVDSLRGFLVNDQQLPRVDVVSSDFGQVMPFLLEESNEDKVDFIIVWTRSESVINAFKNFMEGETVTVEEVLADVDRFAQMLKNLINRAKVIFVPMWTLPTFYRGRGFLDMKKDYGVEHCLLMMNLRLAEHFEGINNIYLLNTSKWIECVGAYAFNPKLWYLGKIPFDPRVFKEASREIKGALRSIYGDVRKLIVIDLDETLWGGIVGDVGWENLKIGGHDPQGEAFVDFQKNLKLFKKNGVLLGIVSKNNEAVALQAINKHPEMILRLNDFSGWRINWEDKAANIVDLAAELNLGLQSIVFIDDSPFERARIRETLPEVFVPEWPEDKMLYSRELLQMSCFDSPFPVNFEDKQKTQMYLVERERREIKEQMGSIEEWIQSLGIKITVREFAEVDLERIVQLLNKTNQMNLTTRRMTINELKVWMQDANHNSWSVRVSDKFGDYGLIGIISLSVDDQIGVITDFVLSCRVFGRKVENAMIYFLINFARKNKLKQIYAKHCSTSKNQPCLDFFVKSGFIRNGENVFVWNTEEDYRHPGVSIVQE